MHSKRIIVAVGASPDSHRYVAVRTSPNSHRYVAVGANMECINCVDAALTQSMHSKRIIVAVGASPNSHKSQSGQALTRTDTWQSGQGRLTSGGEV